MHLDFVQFIRTLYIRPLMVEMLASPVTDYRTKDLKLYETEPNSEACTEMAKGQAT
jgi:hypothetical protein